MRAPTVLPGSAGSLTVRVVDGLARRVGELPVDGLVVGVCGTDKEIAAGQYDWGAPGRQRLVTGHESLSPQ